MPAFLGNSVPLMQAAFLTRTTSLTVIDMSLLEYHHKYHQRLSSKDYHPDRLRLVSNGIPTQGQCVGFSHKNFQQNNVGDLSQLGYQR